MNLTFCFYVLQCSWAPCEEYNLADASSRQLLSQTKCKWPTRPLILLFWSPHEVYCLVVEASLQLVFEFLRSPPSFSSHRALSCFIAFFFFFFFNKNSFPLADQQLMYHLDTTSATRPPFNREAWSPENTLSLFLFPCLSHGPFISSAPHADLTLCSCSASTETSSRRTSWSPNTKSSNSVTLGSPGFSVSL